jgi:hypothetical protein
MPFVNVKFIEGVFDADRHPCGSSTRRARRRPEP